MEQLNRYYRCSKISERKMRQIIRFFAHDLTASKTAELVGLTRRSVTVLFVRIRQRIAKNVNAPRPLRASLKLMKATLARVVCVASADAEPVVKPSQIG